MGKRDDKGKALDNDPTQPVSLDNSGVAKTIADAVNPLSYEKDKTVPVSTDDFRKRTAEEENLLLSKVGLATGPTKTPEVEMGTGASRVGGFVRIQTDTDQLASGPTPVAPVSLEPETAVPESNDATLPLSIAELNQKVAEENKGGVTVSMKPAPALQIDTKDLISDLQFSDDEIEDSPPSPGKRRMINVRSLPESTQSLIENVEMGTPHFELREATGNSDYRQVLGSLILLGPLGQPSDDVCEYENVLEIRSIAAPRRAVLRRALHSERSADYQEIFSSEAEIARQITHSNIVRTYQSGGDHGIPFLVREYVIGTSLKQLANEAPEARLGLTEIAVLAIQVIDALHSIHKLTSAQGANLNLVHGALNPSTILIGQNGRVRITEPIFCKFKGMMIPPSQMTRSQASHYFSPEQREDQSSSASSDWYALGLIIIELLTGKRQRRETALSEEGLRARFQLSLKEVAHFPGSMIEDLIGLLHHDQEKQLTHVRALETFFLETAASSGEPAPNMILQRFVDEQSSEPTSFARGEVSISSGFEFDLQKAKADSAAQAWDDTPLLSPHRGSTRQVGLNSQATTPKTSLTRLPWYMTVIFAGIGAISAVIILRWLGL